MPNTKQTERKATKRPAPAYVDDPGTGAGPDEPTDVEPNDTTTKETPIEDLACFLCGKAYEYRTNVLRHLYTTHGVDADGRILPPAKQEAARKRSRKQPVTKPVTKPTPPVRPAPPPGPSDVIEVITSEPSSTASSTRSRRATEIERLGLDMGHSADSSFDQRRTPTPTFDEIRQLLPPVSTTEAVIEAVRQPPPAPLNPTIIIAAPTPVPAPAPSTTSMPATASAPASTPATVSDKPSSKPTETKTRSEKTTKSTEAVPAEATASKRTRPESPRSAKSKPVEATQTATQHVRRIAGSMEPTAPVVTRAQEARTREAASTSTKTTVDPTVRRPTNPAPVHTPASRPEQTLPEAVRPATRKPSTESGRVLSPSTLYYQLERHPYESVDQLATRLGSRYGWSDDERRQHRSRLLDIRTAQDLNAIDNRKRAPLCRDPATLDAYFQAVADRSDCALLDLDELEDLYVNK